MEAQLLLEEESLGRLAEAAAANGTADAGAMEGDVAEYDKPMFVKVRAGPRVWAERVGAYAAALRRCHRARRLKGGAMMRAESTLASTGRGFSVQAALSTWPHRGTRLLRVRGGPLQTRV